MNNTKSLWLTNTNMLYIKVVDFKLGNSLQVDCRFAPLFPFYVQAEETTVILAEWKHQKHLD